MFSASDEAKSGPGSVDAQNRPAHPVARKDVLGTCRLGDPTNAIGVGAGKYNAQNRTATVTVTGDYQWGFDASNSTRVLGVFWSLSGAAFFNIVLATRIEYRLVFNEVRYYRSIGFVPCFAAHLSYQYLLSPTPYRQALEMKSLQNYK